MSISQLALQHPRAMWLDLRAQLYRNMLHHLPGPKAGGDCFLKGPAPLLYMLT